MAYFHGVKASEVATSVLATVSTTAGLPVVFGTAPVQMADNPADGVLKPIICYSWGEAVKALGYSSQWDKYTLCEAMYSEFKLYNVSPIVFVNVLDPTKHQKSVADEAHKVSDRVVTLADPVLLDTLVVKSGETTGTKDTDYVAAYDDEGNTVISLSKTGALKDAESLTLSYDAADPTKVTETDIINAMELIDSIYTKTSLVPGIIAAPGWSEKSRVAATMVAKALNIDSVFRCIVLTDVDTKEVKAYSDVNEWKNKNSYTNNNQVVCWPCVRQGNAVYHLSTHIMGIIGSLDADNDDVPYKSPSNETLQATGACLADGTEVMLSLTQANHLNSQGIMTALNFNGGWKSWGNYTGAYPSNTDVKDSFICVRRMFDWQRQTFVLNYWQKVDDPTNRRLIKTITDTENIRLNGLTARGYLLGGSVLFLDSDNPTTDLLAGIVRIRTKLTPPVPAQEIEDIIEYDVSNFETLFD